MFLYCNNYNLLLQFVCLILVLSTYIIAFFSIKNIWYFFQVFPYGSVPLKTYLPDGDIDLTALSVPDNEESLAREVLAILQAEELNENAEYHVRDTRFIDAEVLFILNF